MCLWGKLYHLTPLDSSGCELQESLWKLTEEKSCDCHMLTVYSACLPYEEKKGMRFENARRKKK